MTLIPIDIDKKELKDSGQRQQFGTGAVRDVTSGKGAYYLMPPHALFRLARVYEKGALKYAARNWEKGINLSRFWDSATRHWLQVLEGKEDEDHPAQALWNVAGWIQTKYWIDEGILPKSLDDMPRYVRNVEKEIQSQ